MRVDHFASCEIPRFQTSSILHLPPYPLNWFLKSPWRNSSTANAEEFYYSFYYNKELESKPTIAPLLGLAKSIYYQFSLMIFASKFVDSLNFIRVEKHNCFRKIYVTHLLSTQS